MSSMSMPRAATSVATSTVSSPSVKRLQRPLARRLGQVAVDRVRASHRGPGASPRPGRRCAWSGRTRSILPTPVAIAATTLSLSMWCTARNRWYIVPTVSVGCVDRDLDRVLHVPARRGGRRRRRAWPRTASSGAAPVHLRRIHSTCGVKPSSAMRSASSRTTHLDAAQVELVLLEEVDQPQRRGDDDVDTVLQLVDLLVARGAAVDRQHHPVALAATGMSTSATCRASSRVGTSTRPSGRRGSASPVEAGEHRHAEGEGLAGAGAGTSADVLALEGHGDRLGLDGERCGEAGGVEPHVDELGHAEVAEAGGDVRGVHGGGRGGGGAVLGRLGWAATAARGALRACVVRHVGPMVPG